MTSSRPEVVVVDIFNEIKGFLKANSYIEYHPSQQVPKEGLYPFITISRECGAGGYQLASALIEEFRRQDDELFRGWQVLDREMCEKLVAETDLNRSVRDLLSEEYYSELQSLVCSLLGEPSQKTQVYKELFEVIRTLATFGKVIIVGRAGCCVTDSLPKGVHIRLAGSFARRLERVSATGCPDPAHLILQQDRDRARLIKAHFHRDIADPLLYDLVCNTDRIAVEEIIRIVITMIRLRSGTGKRVRFTRIK